MKIHWGHGLILFFIIYISYLIVVVVKSSTVDRGMVVDNYYELDLNYQSKYDEVKNGLERNQKVTMTVDDNQKMHLTFGRHDGVVGNLKFYRPSDSHSDKDIGFKIAKDNDYILDLPGLKAGRWKVQVQWTEGQDSYYQEFDYFLDL